MSCCRVSGTSTRWRNSGRRVPPPPEPDMLLHLVAAGTRMPAWVNAGYREYADRLQGADYRMALTEIALPKRRGEDVVRAIALEGERMLSAAGPAAHIV